MPLTAVGREFNAMKQALEGLSVAVLAQMSSLVAAYQSRDAEALSKIQARDVDIDAREQHVDDLCLRFMQLRSPIGPDFRTVMGIFDIARGLERIGDCIGYVARHAVHHAKTQVPGVGAEIVTSMLVACQGLLEETHACWMESDAKRARAIPPRDDAIDTLQKRAHTTFVDEVRGSVVDPAVGLETVLIANKLEALADVASHLAEVVVMMIEAADIRHGGDRSVTLKAL